MMPRGLIGLLGLGLLLAGTISLELVGRVADDGKMIASAPRPPPASPRPAAPLHALEEDRQALLDSILARPLFAATRRPTAAPSGPAPTPASLPRLAGTMVNGDVRSAIFAGSGTAKAIVVREGAQIGGYTVQSIEPGQVTLAGSGGAHVVRPTFDARSPAAAGPAAGPARGAAAPFATGADAIQSLRGLPGFPGVAR